MARPLLRRTQPGTKTELAMKIKRRKYEQLIERSERLSELEHIRFIVSTPRHTLANVPLVEYALIHCAESESELTQSWWVNGPVNFKFARRVTGYERFLASKYGEVNSDDAR
jgi:hypothetical protein